MLPTTAKQQKKLRRLIRDAVRYVPFYQQRLATVASNTNKLSTLEILAKIPILTKSELLEAPLNERTDTRFKGKQLFVESTTGSTGQPFSLNLDRNYLTRRNLRFARALWANGYRPWQRLLLLTDRFRQPCKKAATRYYVPVEQQTSKIIEAYRRIRPAVLYGFTTPLRIMAEELLRDSKRHHKPTVVISTAEVLDTGTRKKLETAFGCRVFDFYGMTETGLMAWQQPHTAGYCLASDAVLTELLPIKGSDTLHKLVVTNLELRASPIIRFDCGDLATVQFENGTPLITAFDGRRIDTILHRNGYELSPYRVTDAFRDIPGLRRFKVLQRTLEEFDIQIEVSDADRSSAVASIHVMFDDLLGTGLTLNFQCREKISDDAIAKYRPIESHLVHS